MKIIRYVLMMVLFLALAGPAWGATYTVCASGCDGTIADFNAGNAPFDDLDGDTVDFSSEPVTTLITVPDGGANEAGRVTLTGINIDGYVAAGTWTDDGEGQGDYYCSIQNLASTYQILMLIDQNGYPVHKLQSGDIDVGDDVPEGYWAYDSDKDAGGNERVYYDPVGEGPPASGFQGTAGALITIDNKNYITIQNSTLTGGQYGINITNGCDYLTFSNNTITKSFTAGVYSEANANDYSVFDGNTISYCQEGGIRYLCTNATFTDNIFEWNQYAKGFGESHSLGIYLGSNTYTVSANTFRYNGYLRGVTYNTEPSYGDDVTYHLNFDGTYNGTIDRNIFHDNYAGCMGTIGPDSANNVTDANGFNITNNLMFHNNLASGAAIHTVYILNPSGGDENIDLNLVFANNTIINNGNGAANSCAVALIASNSLSGVEIYNNLVANNTNMAYEFRWWEVAGENITATINNNNWYESSGDYLLVQKDGESTKNYPSTNSFATWQTDVSATNDLNADPQLVNSGGENASDYKLSVDSPCINAGIYIYSFEDDCSSDNTSDWTTTGNMTFDTDHYVLDTIITDDPSAIYISGQDLVIDHTYLLHIKAKVVGTCNIGLYLSNLAMGGAIEGELHALTANYEHYTERIKVTATGTGSVGFRVTGAIGDAIHFKDFYAIDLTPTVSTDYDGNPRTGIPDIGAYEFDNNAIYISNRSGSDSNNGIYGEWKTLKDNKLFPDTRIYFTEKYAGEILIPMDGTSDTPIVLNFLGNRHKGDLIIEGNHVEILRRR